MEWLALMQHHGAPTRLLDFTWSPYVAAFFALERATENAAIWAIFPPGLKRPMGPYLTAHYEEDFLSNTKRMIAIGEPLRMNQRLVAQAGTFVLPGVLHEPVESLAPGEAIVKIILEAGILGWPTARRAAAPGALAAPCGRGAACVPASARAPACRLEFQERAQSA